MKTNFLNKLKHGLFLLIAVLGTFVSYSQATTTTTIGGSKTPDPGGFIDIGGKGSTEPILLANVTVTTECLFAFDIGGRGTGTSTDTGQFNDDDIDPYDIGGQIISYVNDPGGSKGTSSDTGQMDSPDDWDDLDTGGRGTNTGTGEFATADIGGGKNSTGGLENTCPICPDTGGGNGGKNTTGELMITDTGGRDTGGGLNPLDDIGGKGGTDTGQFTIYDIGGRSDTGTGALTIAFCGDFSFGSTNVAYFDSNDEENEPIPGCIFDTGGKNGTGTSTGGDIYIVENTLSSDWTENNGCVLRPFFPID